MDATFLFNMISPSCKNLMRDPTVENINHLLTVIESLPEGFETQYQEYIIFPIKYHLISRQKYGHDSNVIIGLLACLNSMMSKSALKTVKEIFNFNNILMPLISSKDFTSLRKDVPEELKLSVVKSWILLHKNMHHDNLIEVYSNENKIYRANIGAVICNCLMLACFEQFLELRLQALECVLVIIRLSELQAVYDANIEEELTDLRISVLPGVITYCKRILTASISHHTLYVKTIELFGKLIASVMEDIHDEENCDVYDYCKKIVERGRSVDRPEVVEDKYEENRKNIRNKLPEFIPTLVSLRKHSHWKVRYELLVRVENLLFKCFRNMGSTVTWLTEAVISLLDDSVEQVSLKSEEIGQRMMNDQNLKRNIIDLLEENFYSLLLRIDSVISSSNEDTIISDLKLLNGYLQTVDLVHLLKPTSSLECFVQTLIHILQMETSHLITLEDPFIIELDNEDTLGRLSEISWLKIKYFTKIEDVKYVFKICDTISKRSDVIGLMHYLLDCLENDPTNRKEIIFLLNNIVFNLQSRVQESVNDMKYILQIFMDPSKFDVPVSILDNENNQDRSITLLAIRSNILQICLLLDGIGKMFACMGKMFSPNLIQCLYGILGKSGSSNPYIAAAGQEALLQICKSCEYPNITSLIADNIDYIVWKNLSYVNYDQQFFDVLSAIIRSCSQTSIDLICDIIEEVLRGRNDILHHSCREGFLRIFQFFVRKIRIWVLPIFKNENFEITESRETYAKVRSRVDKYMRRYRLAEYGRSSSFYKNNYDYDDIDILSDNDSDIHEETVKKEDEIIDDEKPNVPKYVEVITSMCNRILHILPCKQISIKIAVINILMESLLILSEWENQILPLVHKIWSPLVTNVAKNDNLDPLVIRRSFELICMMAVTARDFIRSRTLKEVLPPLTSYLQRTASQSLMKDSGSIYRTSQQYKLQLTVLQELGDLAAYIGIEEKELYSILDAVAPYLSSRQPLPLQESCRGLYLTISSEYYSLVWLQMISIWSPSDVLEVPECLKSFNSFENITIETCTSPQSEYKSNVLKLLETIKNKYVVFRDHTIDLHQSCGRTSVNRFLN